MKILDKTDKGRNPTMLNKSGKTEGMIGLDFTANSEYHNRADLKFRTESMKRIILESDNPSDVEMIRNLASRLDLRIIDEQEIESALEKNKKALLHLHTIFENGGLQDRIPDPGAWQSEIRKDRPLPGRD